MNNYTHILCVKVWSDKLGFCVKDKNIEKIVKEKIYNNEENNVMYNNQYIDTIKWKFKEWDQPYYEMMSGDLVTNSNYNCDLIVFYFTRVLLEKIEKELKEKNVFENDYKLIFTIVKPIVERIPLTETIGFIC
jgi:hypothetical protein